MRLHRAWLAAALALALGSVPASAGDLGIREIGGAVPVPVPPPAPVPTFDADSDWYVGLMLGAVVSQSATIDDSDPNMPIKDSGDIGASPIFGLSFGRYITPSLRAEIAIDYNYDQSLTGDGMLSYLTPKSDGANTNDYAVLRNDEVTLSRTTGLVNLIYDIHTGTRFTPYIGGGVGFSWRKVSRTYSETSTCDATAEFPGNSCTAINVALPENYSTKGSTTKEQLDFAAAVQAGIAYQINDWITWDNGWQMLWEGGAITSTAPSVSGENKIVYKDAILQQFRSGLRIKFN